MPRNFLLGGLLATLGATSVVQADGHFAEADLSPRYAVGIAQNFVRDFNQPFDAWGAKYKSDDYQVFLADMHAKGVPHTTYSNIYYPAVVGEGLVSTRPVNAIPAPLPVAAGGEQVTSAGLFGGSEIVAQFGHGRGNWPENPYQAFVNAPMADGKFPLVIMVHGLGGSVATWASAAEYMASQGYIVVTVSLTSDSTASPIAEDLSSPLAQLDDTQKTQIYGLRASQTFDVVFANFFGSMFGPEALPVSITDWPDPASLTAQPGGGAAAGQSQADLFEQRTADVGRVITEMKHLNEDEIHCKAALEQGNYSKPLCGQFTNRIDLDHIGVMGHSLGSMTAQAAAAFYEDVDTAIGFNNGMPRMWEPWGGFPGKTVDGEPTGVTKPLLMVIASDDDFVHSVFRTLHWQMYEAAGGDPTENYPVPSEQPWPTVDNPQPVARSVYERATAEKMMVILRDEHHGSATGEMGEHFVPGSVLKGTRIPYDPTMKPETYEIFGWIKEGDNDVYVPHVMRNYLVANWLDWQLKGDDAARQRLINQPFKHGIQAMMEDGVSK